MRGDQQTAGADYFKTYAPVTQWPTVRLMFVMSLIADLETVQVDYTNDFAQAKLNEEVYIKVPLGCNTKNEKDVVLELKKPLYGLIQAPHTFYDGFVQAPHTFYEHLTLNLHMLYVLNGFLSFLIKSNSRLNNYLTSSLKLRSPNCYSRRGL